VDNMAGGGGAIGAAEVARARGDGYTMLLGTSTTQIINPAAAPSPSYNPIKDFTLVSMLSVNPTCVIVNPTVPANNLRELIALIKEKPGRFSYGSAGAGTITNLTGELLKFQGGKLDMEHVPYKGGGPAMQDLISGHVPVITPIMSSAVLAQHKAGKARILCVNSESRLKAAPDLPTSAEAGMPELRVQVFNAVFAPAATSKTALTFLKAASQKVLADPAFVQDVERAGAELVTAPDPERFFRLEVLRWNRIIKEIGFKI
jgi:tripartite-type tricarboxylate transporter receptor subunit TctC